MYVKHTNKIAIKSQWMIVNALFSLMKEMPFEQITVTELCKKAEVGRKTFYRNFELREDVIDFYLDQLCQIYENELQCIPQEQYLYHHFMFIKEHAQSFILLYQHGFHSLAMDRFSIILPKTMPIWSDSAVEQEYLSAYVVSGMEAIQKVWIKRGLKESIDEVVFFAQKSVRIKGVGKETV